jgi:hypothetical protein
MNQSEGLPTIGAWEMALDNSARLVGQITTSQLHLVTPNPGRTVRDVIGHSIGRFRCVVAGIAVCQPYDSLSVPQLPRTRPTGLTAPAPPNDVGTTRKSHRESHQVVWPGGGVARHRAGVSAGRATRIAASKASRATKAAKMTPAVRRPSTCAHAPTPTTGMEIAM